MLKLIFLIAFICAVKRKFTQTLNVDINSSTTENAHTGTTKYLLLCPRTTEVSKKIHVTKWNIRQLSDCKIKQPVNISGT